MKHVLLLMLLGLRELPDNRQELEITALRLLAVFQGREAARLPRKAVQSSTPVEPSVSADAATAAAAAGVNAASSDPGPPPVIPSPPALASAVPPAPASTTPRGIGGTLLFPLPRYPSFSSYYGFCPLVKREAQPAAIAARGISGATWDDRAGAACG
jgi:hypothetical protein